MNEQPEISIVISTYNRCELLPGAVESALAQEARGVGFEVIVVDNNSTDDTRRVVEAMIARGHDNLRYVFEGEQGLSHARNAGIACARAPIVAFTDDDVRAAPDWVASIKRAFDEHPEAVYVGGKVLPRWQSGPPEWLTAADHWTPLALLDYGDAPVSVGTERPICLIGANFSFRREVFDRFGLFAPELQRVKDGIGSMEDYEFQRRLWDAGMKGIYSPDVIISAEVQSDRLTKAYHRRWHTGHGRFHALMRDAEVERSAARLFDVPSHLYRQAAEDVAGWLKHSIRGERDKAFSCETRLRFFKGFFGRRRGDFLVKKRHSTLTEVVTFVRALVSAKINPT